MKRLLTTFVLTLISLSYSFAILPPPITLGTLFTTSFCVGSSASLGFTADTYPSEHNYAVQLSDSNGSFNGTPTVLGSGQSSPISFTLPSYSSGTTSNYVLRIIDQNDITRVSGSSAVIYFAQLGVKLQTLGGQTSTYICNGSSVKLYTTTNFPDNSYFTYYWYKDNSSIPVSTTDNSYTTNQTGVYQVRVQRYGCDGYVSTNSFNVSNINDFYSEYFTYGNSFSQYQCAETNLAFKSVYEAENATYQWKKDGVVIGGETKSILNITQSGAYTLTVNDANCTVPASYTLTKNLTFGNIIPSKIYAGNSYSTDKDTLTFCSNINDVSLYCDNFSNKSSYSYQWKRNGINISDETNYNIYNIANEGIYSLKITQGGCNVISKNIFLKSSNISSRKIKSYGTKACIGENILLFIDGLKCGTYQWQKDGIDILQSTYSSYYATQSGSYRVKIFEDGINYYSNTIIINISDTQSYIISENNAGYNNCVLSKSFYLSDPDVYFSGMYYNATFQWYKNDIMISAATNFYYEITSSGTYKLKVTKGLCEGFSQNQDVIIPPVLQVSKPQIISYVGSLICAGSYSNLSSTYFSNANYEWKKNGLTILNQLGKYSIDVSQSGNYTVTVTRNTCTATSDPLTINIGDKQQSIKNSNWNDPTMWSCGTVPSILEDALINKGHTILVPNNYTGFVKDLQLNGTLQYGNNALLKYRTN